MEGMKFSKKIVKNLDTVQGRPRIESSYTGRKHSPKAQLLAILCQSVEDTGSERGIATSYREIETKRNAMRKE